MFLRKKAVLICFAVVNWLTYRYLAECTPLPSPECPSKETTSTGDCCLQCPPGWGVQSRCSAFNNTICMHCYADITFSPEPSHTAGCMPCKRCARNEFVRHSCNITHDTLCECRRNYYHTADGSCSQCNTCPPGFGATVKCATQHNTECESCANGTYSDLTSATKGCVPCSTCLEGTVVLEMCTRFSDTVCSDTVMSTTTAYQHSSETPDTVAHVINSRPPSIVPIYCAILAFVVIGLLGYVIFKRWSFRKVKLRSHAKQTRSPLGSPSKADIDVSSAGAHSIKKSADLPPSLAPSRQPTDQTPLMTVPSTTLYRDLSTTTRSEVESLLGISRLDRRDWRGLAHELGFSDKDIVHFIKTSDDDLPVHRMLTVWSDREGAVVSVLVAALKSLNRQDVLQKLPVFA
ncbi:tumor necrosis factor receptor superfamily member 16-like [Acanthaster planci]|uniref:Tumor necrosis factor receptor superfamily member 16-like n=1 Tax=Acanthaster planci TaxID=133434 RepID=A0A8B7ZJ02_ACAPL|nr:tumor necrosis factor receptor superfamily member 16-like [Acanthaster planci]